MPIDIKIPEKNKKAGLSYALSPDGIELPVVDVTHPAFALKRSEAEDARLLEAFVQDAQRRKKTPGFVIRLMLRLFARRSLIVRGMFASGGSYLDGMTTYLLKLGPEMLGAGYSDAIDRKISRSLPSVSVRVRLEDMARLISAGLAPELQAAPRRPLQLINIAGGPAMDSLNALILLRRQDAALLEGRAIQIHVLDLRQEGSDFGARALEAMRAEGGALQGLDIQFHAHPYDWDRHAMLQEILEGISPGDAILAASSEGGLFDYGSDGAIVANLRCLHGHMGANGKVSGSVTRSDGPGAYLKDTRQFALRPRDLEDFRKLAEKAGWKIDTVLTSALYFNLRLAKM